MTHDQFSKMAPYLDLHLVDAALQWIGDNLMYNEVDIWRAKLGIAKRTNMFDYVKELLEDDVPDGIDVDPAEMSRVEGIEAHVVKKEFKAIKAAYVFVLFLRTMSYVCPFLVATHVVLRNCYCAGVILCRVYPNA